jgi:hypothetical protein
MDQVQNFIALVALLGAIVLFFRLKRPRKAQSDTPFIPAPPTRQASNPKPTHHLEGNDSFAVEVAGESRYQAALDEIVGGKSEDGAAHECIALLRRQPDNPHDPNAIAVTIDGHLVGFVERATAARLAPMLDARKITQASVNALITGGWQNHRSEGSYGVSLDIA